MPTTPHYILPRIPSRFAPLGRLGDVCRLGLATRTGNHLNVQDVFHALDHGINYLNWPGEPDALCAAVRAMNPKQRASVFVAVQLEARSGRDAQRELDKFLAELGTEYIDVLTFYYVEHAQEWDQLLAPGGAAEAMSAAKEQGKVRMIGLTSHQRRLAAAWAQSGRLDLLMVRYNAAHRGAEQDLFPITDRLGLPVVTYTGLRWRALMEPTPDDPPGFVPPAAAPWYRFVLAHPSVTVGLMAPDTRAELEENLHILRDWRALSAEEYAELVAHAQRVRRHAGSFP